MLERLQLFYEKSQLNRAIVLGVIIIIFGVPFIYILNRNYESSKEKKDVKDNISLETQEGFKDIRSTYHQSKEEYSHNRIESVDDFFDVSQDSDTLGTIEYNNNIYAGSETSQELIRLQQAAESQQIEASSNDSLLQSILDSQEDQDRIDEIRRIELKAAKEKEEEEEEEYYQYLRQLKKEREAEKQEAQRIKRENEVYSVIASIYGSKEVIPKDYVQLILAKDYEIFGKTYKREEVSILAQIEIKDHRIFLNITDISGNTFSIKVIDTYDNKEGLYSKRAAELWDEYLESQTIRDEVSNTIQRGVTTTVMGTAIHSIGEFFRKKKNKKRSEILIPNGKKVKLKIRKI